MQNQLWRKIILFALIIAVSMLPAACGDDDDHDSPAAPASGDDPPGGEDTGASAEMLELYDFTLRIQGARPFLTLVQPVGDSERTLVVSNQGGGSFTGTYDPAAGQVTFDGGSTFVLTATNYWGEDDTLESFPILIEEDIVFQEDFPGMQDNFPVAGSFSLRYAVNTIRVDFVSDDEDLGVSMRRNDEPAVFSDFEEFDDLLDENVMVWQQKASLAYNVMEFMAEQAILAARTVDVIDRREPGLEENGSVSFECGTFPPDAVLDPVDLEPSRTLTWLDTNEDGQISGGDAFRWQFLSCWINDGETAIDDLMHGRIDLMGYIRNVEQRDGQDVLTRFGFEPEVQTTSGVIYTDLVQTEIEEETPEVLSVDPKRTYIVNGGYNIVFSEPAAAQ